MGEHEIRRAVFLDRDGVLNQPVLRDGRAYPPMTVEEFQLYPGVPEACAELKAAGFLLVVATNQPDVGRGRLAPEVVEAMHQKLQTLLPVDRVEVCFAAGSAFNQPSDFRKPAPGMLLRAARELKITLPESWMIGDRWRDIDCGRVARCRTILIDHGYDEELRTPPDFTVKTFPEAARIILDAFHEAERRRRRREADRGIRQ